MQPAAVDTALELPADQVGEALLDLAENQWFERKSARVAPKDLAIPLVAMANAEGGIIVVGLHNGQIEDVTPEKTNALRQTGLDHTSPPVRVRATELPVQTSDGSSGSLLVLHVEPGETVHTLSNGTAYLRVGDESRRLNPAQLQELTFDRGSTSYDGTPIALSVADLDEQQLRAYTDRIGSSTVDNMLAARDLVTRRGQLTVAACLLFDERPQREFPNAIIRVLKYGENDRGVGSSMTLEEGADVRFEGSLPQQITQAADAIESMVPRWRQLTERGLFEPVPRIPRDAWLEGLVNAVVHRAYSQMGDHIRFEIFPNRIEITSPGRFPGIVDPARPLEISRFARNPRIARVCADLGITRELGEGIKRMFAEMRRRGLTDPMYTQGSSSVRLTLMATDAVPEEILSRLTPSAKTLLDALRATGKPMGTGALADIAGISRMTATRALAQLREEGLVTWSGQSAKDPRAAWTLN